MSTAVRDDVSRVAVILNNVYYGTSVHRLPLRLHDDAAILGVGVRGLTAYNFNQSLALFETWISTNPQLHFKTTTQPRSTFV